MKEINLMELFSGIGGFTKGFQDAGYTIKKHYFSEIDKSGKMLKERSPQMMAQTFGQFSMPLPTLGVIDLNGNCLIQAGFYPKIESGYTLSDILQEEVIQEYFLSEKMISFLTSHSEKMQEKGNGFKFNPIEMQVLSQKE